jgi:ectoine hydroxylase-related dioxygenase (phytanoyl-CoA dioxygenase family)
MLGSDEVEALRGAIEAAPERDPGRNPLTLDTMRFASNLFYGSTELQRFLCSGPVVDLLCSVGPQDLWVRWDQAVWKGPEAPAFPWHQDNGYTALSVEHLQLWVALTPMRPTNGGLVLAPGGHRSELEHRWVGNHVEIEEPAAQVSIDASAGDVVLFSSYLPHMTTPNVTGEERLAYVAEYLPVGTEDPSVRPPHLVAARSGAPVGRFAGSTAHGAGATGWGIQSQEVTR